MPLLSNHSTAGWANEIYLHRGGLVVGSNRLERFGRAAAASASGAADGPRRPNNRIVSWVAFQSRLSTADRHRRPAGADRAAPDAVCRPLLPGSVPPG